MKHFSWKNRRTRALALSILLTVLLLLIYLCGVLIPDTAIAGNYAKAGLPPSAAHPFGTDALGRDLLCCTFKGLSLSITIGVAASLASALIAILIGLLSAVGSKRVDAAVGWLIDLVMSVPHTILIILISFVLGRGFFGLLAGIAATHWCSLARLIRAEVMQLRTQPYVQLSRRLGRSDMWILRHHLLPHLMPQLLVGTLLLFPHAILHEASVSFLGFGLPPERATIGQLLAESLRYLSAGMWWSALLPGAALVILVLLFDRLGETLRLLTDPYRSHG